MRFSILMVFVFITSFGQSQVVDSISSSKNLNITNKNSGKNINVVEGTEIRANAIVNSKEKKYFGDLYILNDSTIMVDSAIVNLSQILVIEVSTENFRNSGRSLMAMGIVGGLGGAGLLIQSTTFLSSDPYGDFDRFFHQIGGTALITLSTITFFIGKKIKNGRRYSCEEWNYSIVN